MQDKYNTCALSKHIGKYVYSARNAGKGSAPVSKPYTHITYMLRQCTSIVYVLFRDGNEYPVTGYSLEHPIIECQNRYSVTRKTFFHENNDKIFRTIKN